jgi:hypothetical protein
MLTFASSLELDAEKARAAFAFEALVMLVTADTKNLRSLAGATSRAYERALAAGSAAVNRALWTEFVASLACLLDCAIDAPAVVVTELRRIVIENTDLLEPI